MEAERGASWSWALPLIVVTIALHAFGVALLTRTFERLSAGSNTARRLRRHPLVVTACVLGFVG